MANSPLYRQIAEAIVVGIQDHGPMTVQELVAFLNGYGLELDPTQAPQQIRQAVHYHKDRIQGTRVSGVTRYHLK